MFFFVFFYRMIYLTRLWSFTTLGSAITTPLHTINQLSMTQVHSIRLPLSALWPDIMDRPNLTMFISYHGNFAQTPLHMRVKSSSSIDNCIAFLSHKMSQQPCAPLAHSVAQLPHLFIYQIWEAWHKFIQLDLIFLLFDLTSWTDHTHRLLYSNSKLFQVGIKNWN